MGHRAMPERDAPRQKQGLARLCCSGTGFAWVHLPGCALPLQIGFRLLEEEHSKHRVCTGLPKQSPVLPQRGTGLTNTMANTNPATQSAKSRHLCSPAKTQVISWRRDVRHLHLPAGPGRGEILLPSETRCLQQVLCPPHFQLLLDFQ